MLEQLKQYISEKNLFTENEKILVAVSGGIDSVVLCELFQLAKYKFAIAHCNFQLRGRDSDEDAKFVKKLAKKHCIFFFSKKFDTAKYAANKGISIQMAARELRYEWFEKVRKENRFEHIAVATQRNDEIETVLINFTRGTGMSGLHGILPVREKIIRPLLFATRKEILEFALDQNLKWREDKSNISEEYVRNKIRHNVIPVLKEINPDFEQTATRNIKKIRDAEAIFHQRVNEKKREIFIVENVQIKIPIRSLLQLAPLTTYLFEFLKPFHFNETVVEEIVDSLNRQPGKKFFSDTHCIIKERNYLLLFPDSRNTPKYGIAKDTAIYAHTKHITHPAAMKFKVIKNKNFNIIRNKKVACLDYNKLMFPLVLRKWKSGDRFIPLGMKGNKKISDFLIDEKIPLSEKEQIKVLVSSRKIVWVVGLRIDDRFKVTGETKKIFMATAK